MRLNRRGPIPLALRAVLGAALLAAPAALTLAPTAPARAQADATQPVRALYARVEETLKAGVPDLKARVAAVGPTFNEVFDLPALVQLAVGAKWKGLKPEQQKAVTDAFATYFTTLYANRLSQAGGGKFEIKPGTEARGGNTLVHSVVTTKDGDDSEVDYLVNPAGKIQDVLLNGNVSEAASLRAGFADPLKKGGAEALVKFMNERTDTMLAAKPKP